MTALQHEVRVGDYGTDMGYGNMVKQVTITAGATGAPTTFTHSFTLPKCEIIDIIVDVEVVWASGTSAVLSVGASGAATKFASGVNVKASAVRIRPTFTAAQLTQMKAVAAGTYIIDVVQTGAGTTGNGNVRIVYAPKK